MITYTSVKFFQDWKKWIAYTEAEVDLLVKTSSLIKFDYASAQAIRELKRGFRHGDERPHIGFDLQNTNVGLFLQRTSFKDVPLFLNDPNLKHLAEWRLRIGK
jgi:hypothetical protein